jgi:hypothetical protein
MPLNYPEVFEEDGMESARRVPCPRASRVRRLAANGLSAVLEYSLWPVRRCRRPHDAPIRHICLVEVMPVAVSTVVSGLSAPQGP